MSSSTSNSSEVPTATIGHPEEEMERGLSRTKSWRAGRRRGRVRRYVGWGLFCLVALLVLADVFVFRNVDTYGHSPGFIGQIAELKASFAAADPERIQVAVIGDSMSLDALRPELLEADAGLPAGSVFNFSLSGGSAFDMAGAYETYADRLPNLRKAIVVMNEHQINNADAATDVKFKYYAGLRDRLAAMDADNYGALLVGWAWKAYDLRSEWKMLLEKGWHDYRHPDEKKQLRAEIPAYPGGLKPVPWSPKSDKTYEHAVEVADRWFLGYDLTGVRTDALDRLIGELTRRGVQVELVQIPRTPYFEEAVTKRHAAEQEQYRDVIRSLAKKYGAGYTILSNEGMDPSADFRDTNHVSPDGAKKVSAEAAKRWLR